MKGRGGVFWEVSLQQLIELTNRIKPCKESKQGNAKERTEKGKIIE